VLSQIPKFLSIFCRWFSCWIPRHKFAAACRVGLSLEDESGEDDGVS
jgi:hypothetical protein